MWQKQRGAKVNGCLPLLIWQDMPFEVTADLSDCLMVIDLICTSEVRETAVFDMPQKSLLNSLEKTMMTRAHLHTHKNIKLELITEEIQRLQALARFLD